MECPTELASSVGFRNRTSGSKGGEAQGSPREKEATSWNATACVAYSRQAHPRKQGWRATSNSHLTQVLCVSEQAVKCYERHSNQLNWGIFMCSSRATQIADRH
eukprot:scaffold59862_cov21-Tisochrysis_lutea.AAC.1